MICSKQILYYIVFIIGCILIYYGFSVSQNGYNKQLNEMPWSWIIIIGIIIVVVSGYKIVKQ